MYAGGQLPNRLKRNSAVLLLFFCACASDRYIGSIGARGTYSNRGFGLVLDLGQGDLAKRWQAFDPKTPELIGLEQRPMWINAPIDLDGDGTLRADETTQHYRPTIRLVARTASTATVATSSITPQIDIDVAILGGEEAARPIDNVTRAAARELLGASAVLEGELSKRQLGPDFDARIASGKVAGKEFKLAVIDQSGFYATETAVTRRQAVRVLLTAAKIDSALIEDFQRVLSGLVLSARGGALKKQEQW